MQSLQIRVFSLGTWSARIFFGLPLGAARILLALFLLLSLLTITLCDSCFAWSSDGVLLQYLVSRPVAFLGFPVLLGSPSSPAGARCLLRL